MVDYGKWDVMTSMPAGAFGFIYLVENRISGRKYIGKKQLHSYTSKKVPGKIRRTKTVTESDWRNYQTSSKYVKDDIKTLGIESFSFLILEWCMTRSELSFREAELQWKNDVLSKKTLEDGSRLWYNHAIPAIKFLKPDGLECISDETREKISNNTRRQWRTQEFIELHTTGKTGSKNPMFKGRLVGVRISDGHVEFFEGEKDLIEKGVIERTSHSTPIYRCANKTVSKQGKRYLTAKGYKWYWESEYEA